MSQNKVAEAAAGSTMARKLQEIDPSMVSGSNGKPANLEAVVKKLATDCIHYQSQNKGVGKVSKKLMLQQLDMLKQSTPDNKLKAGLDNLMKTLEKLNTFPKDITSLVDKSFVGINVGTSDDSGLKVSLSANAQSLMKVKEAPKSESNPGNFKQR